MCAIKNIEKFVQNTQQKDALCVCTLYFIILLMSVEALLLYSFSMLSRRILVKLYIHSMDHFDIHYKGIYS